MVIDGCKALLGLQGRPWEIIVSCSSHPAVEQEIRLLIPLSRLARLVTPSMTPTILYLSCVVGAIGLFLVMRPHKMHIRALGTLIGAAAIAFLMVTLLKALPDDSAVPWLEIFFGLGAILAAGRLVTHPRPVFAAVYFVLVVVSSAGLFLMMNAEFMAFALIIVYAGAILITYLFVLMLAQEASTEEGESPYNYVPREPIPALIVGFVLIASIGDVLLSENGGVEPPSGEAFIENAYTERWEILEQMPRQQARLEERLAEETGQSIAKDSLRIENGEAWVTLVDSEDKQTPYRLGFEHLPTNTQEVGWELVAGFPVGLEIAGVILLMAMFGAVVLARRQIELGEDERRIAGGLEPITPDEDAGLSGGDE